MSRSKHYLISTLIILYLIVWIWAAWDPVDRFVWFLENILIFIFFFVFIPMHRKYTFSMTSYLFIFLFLTLHTIGAHYSYQTPIDPWLKQWFELDRAYYDRVVHFTFGLLMIIPIKDWLEQLLRQASSMIIAFLSIIILFSAGAFYELIEMWVAQIVAPEQGTTFLGLQGDPWDTHHDMELALYGSLITLLIYYLVIWFQTLKTKKDDNPSTYMKET